MANWQTKGWEISMHGYNHIYDQKLIRMIFSNTEVNQNFSVTL